VQRKQNQAKGKQKGKREKGIFGHFAVVVVVVNATTHHLVVVNFANGSYHAVHHNNGGPVKAPSSGFLFCTNDVINC